MAFISDMPLVNNRYVAPERIKIQCLEWKRIVVAINDNLLSWQDEYGEFIERIEEQASYEGDLVSLDLQQYLELGKFLSSLVSEYLPHLNSWCERDGAEDIPILDYAEEFACINEALQIYLGNADYKHYLLSIEYEDRPRRKALRKTRENN